MKFASVQEASNWWRAITRERRRRELAPELLAHIETEANPAIAKFLKSELVTVRILNRDFASAEALLREIVAEDLDDPLPMMRLADTIRFDDNRTSEALGCMDDGIARADRARKFRRQTRGEKARVLLRLKDYSGFAACLDEIMALDLVPGFDIRKERDFFDSAPRLPELEDVLARYEAFLASGVQD